MRVTRGQGVHGQELVEGDEPRQQDGHGLRVLASGGRESDEGTAFDHVAAVGRNVNYNAGSAVMPWGPLMLRARHGRPG